jgi:hypothetical protein
MVRKQQQGDRVLRVVRADGCERNNGIRHATAKQQLHCKRGTVFSTWSVPRCYKQDN